jgi:hypothetical protein
VASVAGTERAYERKHEHEQETPEIEQEHEEPEFVSRSAVPVAGLANPTVRRTGTVPHDELGGTAVAPDIATTLSRRRGQGAPLPDSVAGSMGEAYGMDFSPVRVHNDGEADTISRSLQASAFTYGTDIYFSGGTFEPTSQGGQHLLAHELAHVVQQSTGADSASASGPMVGRANDPAETSADAMADQAVSTLRRQAARVDVAPVEAPVRAVGGSTEAVRRQAKLVGTPAGGQVIRRGFFSNLWDKLRGKKPKEKESKEEAKDEGGTGGSTDSKSSTTSSTGGTGTTPTPKPTTPPPTTTPSESKDTGGGTGGTETTTGGGTGPTTAPLKVETTTPVKEDEKDTKPPEAKYPTTIKIGSESFRVESADEEEEAKTIVSELQNTYGIALSSPDTISGIKGEYSNVMKKELAKLKASTWEMKEIRGLLAGVKFYAPILGTERAKSTLKDKAQGVTSVGKLQNAIDKDSKKGKLDNSTLGEYFSTKKNVGMFGAVTDYSDPEIIREGAKGPDNETGIEATAIHEMAHGLVAPYEINNWVAKLPYWKDEDTESGVKGAEKPPTGYGETNAAEDLCESVALYFLNKPLLQSKCPERVKLIDKIVAGWTPKEKKEAIEGTTKATGAPEPEDGKAA